jgi:hypothetical protein
MHAFTNQATARFQPIVSAARSNRRRQRIYFRLRNLGRAVVAAIIGIASFLLKALQDSRSEMAARVIHEHRHLLEGAAPAANAQQSERGKMNAGSNDIMSWRLYFLLAGLMMVFAFAHLLALQKLNEMQSGRPPAAIDLMAD